MPNQTNTPAPPARSMPLPAPLRWALDLFSSVWLGVTLMTVLFVYCTIGSAGLFYPTGLNIFRGENWHIEFVRQWPVFELTEFEWFHTWFFNLNIALICLNITVTTVRRIRLSWLNAGVWMIHAGIIILSVGSVVYFAKKVEGDAPIIRRSVRVAWNGEGTARPVSIPALPGNRVEVPAPGGVYVFEIASIDPAWPIQSEADKGKRAYSVSVGVTRPDGERYIRQLLDGFPQYTEDVIPGKGRFKKQPESEGRAIFDEQIAMELMLEPQDRFWIKDSWAILSRSADARAWHERPIEGLPRYNDYVPDAADVWAATGEPLRVQPLNIGVPAVDADDPLRDAQVRVTGFLRYAIPQTQMLTSGGASLFPVVDMDFVNATAGGQRVTLAALDPSKNTAAQGLVAFRWVNDAEGLDRLRAAAKRTLTIAIPSLSVRETVEVSAADLSDVDNAPWRDVPGTEGKFAYRIKGVADNLAMPAPDESGNTSVWILMVEFRTPEKTFTRFVADIPGRSRDVGAAADQAHGMSAPDPGVVAEYTPALLAPVTIVAGPGDLGLRAILNAEGQAREEPLKPGQEVRVNDMLTMKVRDWSPSGRVDERPAIVPKSQRDPDVDRASLLTMCKVEITRAGKTISRWLPFHRYAFTDDGHTDPSLGRFMPTRLRFDDGREVELLFSRQSMALPTRVALADFVVTSHVGGFEPGKMGSIRDWTSQLAFEDPASPGGWTPARSMSTNDPVSYKGFWYFQSYWDAPRMPRFQGDTGSNGLNYTGVGIGNREGVYTQLAGCCVSVAGMLYAFYYKPILRRRMKLKAVAEAEAAGRLGVRPAPNGAAGTAAKPIGATAGDTMVSPEERSGLLESKEAAR